MNELRTPLKHHQERVTSEESDLSLSLVIERRDHLNALIIIILCKEFADDCLEDQRVPSYHVSVVEKSGFTRKKIENYFHMDYID
jgi:hypothetical protein